MRIAAAFSPIGQFGLDFTGACLGYQCSAKVGVEDVSSGGPAAAVGCSKCSAHTQDLPLKVERFCLPTTVAKEEGGLYKVRPGWIILASASWANTDDDEFITEGSTVGVSPTWHIHQPDEDGLSVGHCAGLKTKSPDGVEMVEIHVVGFAGSPAQKAVANKVRKAKSKEDTHGVIHVELVDHFNKLLAKTVQQEQRPMLKRILFGKRKMKSNEGIVVSLKRKLLITQAATIVPESSLDLRITCMDKQCYTKDFYGCIHVMCRKASIQDIQLAIADEALKEQVEKEVREVVAQKKAVKEHEEAAQKAKEVDQAVADYERKLKEEEFKRNKRHAAENILHEVLNKKKRYSSPLGQEHSYRLPPGAIALKPYALDQGSLVSEYEEVYSGGSSLGSSSDNLYSDSMGSSVGSSLGSSSYYSSSDGGYSGSQYSESQYSGSSMGSGSLTSKKRQKRKKRRSRSYSSGLLSSSPPQSTGIQSL